MAINSNDIYNAIVQNSFDGILVSDLENKIVFCNEAISRLIGYQKDDLINQSIFKVTDTSYFEQQSQLKFSNKDNHNNHNENEICNLKNHTLFSYTLFSYNGTELSLPASHSIIKNDLGQVVGFLTIIYIVQANSVQQAQSEFVSTVSHELRTPLTSIKGFADTILRAGERLDVAQQRRYIGIIKDQSDRLTRLVEDLLAVSRLESKKMQLTIRAIDLGAAVSRVLRNLADKASQHRLITQLPPGLTPVWADSDRLEQILTNLIDNAIKYSPSNTCVTISARELICSPPIIEFSVTDQGLGIPSEHLDEIFSKFNRLDNPLVRQTEGTGLGLYITRSLVIALGGKISVTSSPGNTTFTVKLPAATLEQQAARGRD